MNREEVLEECTQMIDVGADMIEIFEWVEDNTDLDPTDIIHELFYTSPKTGKASREERFLNNFSNNWRCHE